MLPFPLDLETKFSPLQVEDIGDGVVEGHAAIFGEPDRTGDVVRRGAFARSLASRRSSVKFLWQHDPASPIGVWNAIAEDARGLHVRGRLLTGVRRGAEAAALLAAGALDGLSIGYRTVRSERSGAGRILTEIDLWEISLVTFPMAEGARLSPPVPRETELADAIREAARAFAG